MRCSFHAIRWQTIAHTALLISVVLFGQFIGSELYGQTQPSAGMMRFPDVSNNQIVFSFADDLWVVSRDGGVAVPLASPVGQELTPRFSADGNTIAFVGNYDGGSDIYTVPTTGGPAKRLTFHPATESLCDWNADGSLLYSTNAFAGLERMPQLFQISDQAPLPKQLPVPYGTNGAISSDGEWLAYTPYSRDMRTWKRYRGGMASDVWLFNLKTGESKQITDFEGTDTLPMWHNDTVYYLSDNGEEHRLNIWAYNIKSGEHRQITKFADFDIKWPSMGPGPDGNGEIVFQCGSHLYLLDIATSNAKTVDISIPGDRPKLRSQKVDVSESFERGDLSPSGNRVVVEARGDIWTVPAKNGSPRNLTASSGVAERDPSWSPDGRWIAYFSDKSGEYELYVSQSDGRGETKQLTSNGNCFRYSPTWSPDSKMIAFTDKTGTAFLHNVESNETKQIDNDPYAAQLGLSWSHDSAWITYAKSNDTKSQNNAVWVYNVANGEKQQLTNGFFNDSSPVFDRKGDYIFFASSRAFNRPQYEDTGTSFIYSNTEVLIAMPLRNDVKYPFIPKSDEATWKDDKDKKEEGEKSDSEESDQQSGEESDKKDDSEEKEKSDDDEKSDDKEISKKGKSEKPVTIDFDEIARRAFQLPVSQGNFGSLAVNDKNQVIYSRRPPRGSEEKPSIKLFDLTDEKREEKTVVDGATGFAISADGKKLLVRQRRSAHIVAAAAGQKLDSPVPFKNMIAMIDPREEWKQVFTDAWRIQRDFFYDPNMHGVNWVEMRNQYEPMLKDCVSRSDVSFVIGEMISEINVGHAYYRGSDSEVGPRSDVGLLGCRFDIHEGAYRIAELYEGAPWDVDARNPLRQVGVKPNEFLLAVNGADLTTEINPYSMFQGLAGQTVGLTISTDSVRGNDDDREVLVKPLSEDNDLRFRHWIEQNRKMVEEKSSGRIGYIYVTNTGVPGQNDLIRHFYGQLDKEALIIDERWNGGGQIPTRFIELLNRPVTNYWARRDGRDWIWPPDSHQGPKCMLINGMSGSGGDMFPALFRMNNIGKLIGRRTWGGLVGISGNPSMIDGSGVTSPTFAFYEKDGTWGIEGHGVDPDIEVIDDPAKMQNGGDPQLETAINHMLDELEKNPFQPPARPKYPNRSKFGLDPKDK
jgi:tricorn protease